MFEHLLSPEFDDLSEVDTPTLLSAQATTADWLMQMGSPEHILTDAGRNAARRAFSTSLNPDVPENEKKAAVLALKVPAAVRHLAGMLSEYDWAYVEQAKELRGYVVAKLLEETSSGDPRIRLRALELIGKLTEVGSFTTRIEVTQASSTVDDLTERLRSKLQSLLPTVVEIESIAFRGATSAALSEDAALDAEISQVAPVQKEASINADR